MLGDRKNQSNCERYRSDTRYRVKKLWHFPSFMMALTHKTQSAIENQSWSNLIKGNKKWWSCAKQSYDQKWSIIHDSSIFKHMVLLWSSIALILCKTKLFNYTWFIDFYTHGFALVIQSFDKIERKYAITFRKKVFYATSIRHVFCVKKLSICLLLILDFETS